MWNALDHLNTATRTGANAVAESYQYDDSGRRISKTSGATTTSYLYDGDAIHAEWSGAVSGNPAAAYVHGAGIDEPLLRLTGATSGPGATQAAYLQDGLGSVVGTTNITGTLTANQRFDAWGVKTTSSGTVPQYGYTGREPDATGLTFYRARYYHPGLGRFASRDPMGMVDAVSGYAYVRNNPVNYTDPTGEIANFVAGGIYGTLAGAVGGFITARAAGRDTIGTVQSVFLGAAAGGGVGMLNPALSNRAGAAAASFGLARGVGTVPVTAAVGGASSAVGQLAGNVIPVFTGKPMGTNFSWGAVGGSAVGAPLAILPAKIVGNAAATTVGTSVPFGSRSLTIVTPTVQHTGSTFRAITGGAIGGVFEASGQAFESMLFPTTPTGGAASGSQNMASFSQLSAPQNTSNSWGTSSGNYSSGGFSIFRQK